MVTGLPSARIVSLAAIVVLVALVPAVAAGPKKFSASLSGYNEVPAISSPASGSVRVSIDEDAGTLEYELQFDGLQAAVVQAHIHFAQAGVNGGVMVFLCGTAASPGPAGTPTCPAAGSVSGLLTAGGVIGPGGQGIAALEFNEVVAAIRAGRAYANVHSMLFPGGEIRGQLRPGGGHKDDDKDK